jgi:hypothetical protein
MVAKSETFLSGKGWTTHRPFGTLRVADAYSYAAMFAVDE